MGKIENTIQNINKDLFTIGSNEITPVTDEYMVPFKFKGEIKTVIIDVKSA